jgi:transcription elongation GreA/GreB family factor
VARSYGLGCGVGSVEPASPRSVQPCTRVRIREGDGRESVVRLLFDDRIASKLDVGAGSPLGRALVGRAVGEQVRVLLAAGIERLVTVVEVE